MLVMFVAMKRHVILSLAMVIGVCALACCSPKVDAPAPSGSAPTPPPPIPAPSTTNAEPAKKITGWLNWRGPHQNGMSNEKGLPTKLEVGGKNQLWTYEISGRGQPVIANGRVYAWGYRGDGPNLQEVLLCLNEADGKLIWEFAYGDYLSDTVYSRYSVGSPTIDPETGNIHLMSTNGGVYCFSPEGKVLWQYSLMERFGRLTFPNGRTGAAVVDGDIVITRGVTSYWGADGPARDRFYAFDKRTGAPVWSSTPGIEPKDSSFSTPVLANIDGRRVFFAGTGCGNVACIDARTGQPLWRFQLSAGGVNCSVLVQDDIVVAIHGQENVDSSEEGRMVGIRMPAKLPAPGEPMLILGKDNEAWRHPYSMFTSSATLANGRVYQVTKTGELVSIEAKTGKLYFAKKMENGQLHASPLSADGKLYVGFPNGAFYILNPKDDGVDVVDKSQLEGECLGQPTAWNGKLYIHTSKRLYCFGKAAGDQPTATLLATAPRPADSKPFALQIVPSDVLLRPSESAKFSVNTIDQYGNVLEKNVKATFASYIPPTALVKAEMNGTVDADGTLVASSANTPSAGAFKATAGDLSGLCRGRVLPKLPYAQDFEKFALVGTNVVDGARIGFPPLPWIGARLKWEVREMEGNKVLAKTLDNLLFQRAITFIAPESSNYTVQADVMTDGNRRTRSNVGLINQRYFITLIGNQQILEVSSNHERVKESVPFTWAPNKWYCLKSRVDVAADGTGTVRAKAWAKGEPEPEAWTLEVKHQFAHQSGAPGLIGFSPQSLFRVYVDNISINNN